MPTVIASACCCGVTCRWHGKPTRKSARIRSLEEIGYIVVPVCPEMLGGLPCPRPPITSRKGRVAETDPETRTMRGRDRTAEFQAGAAATVRIARRKGVVAAYMFRLSPSCAPSGIAGRALTEAGIPVIPIW